MVKDLLLKNRSYRRFVQADRIEKGALVELVDMTRYCASGRNAQTLKYAIVYDEDKCQEVFETLSWAGYLKDWAGAVEGERPSAYIIQINDDSISSNYFCDDGIAAQSILLGAVEKGLGGCILRAFKKVLNDIIRIPKEMHIIQVIALGVPLEEVVIDDMLDDYFKYWRDEKEIHHVPKRKLEDILI